MAASRAGGLVSHPRHTGPAWLPSCRQPAGAANRRPDDPAEVAEMVLWLSSEKASYVTGAHFVVDAGATA